MKKIILILLLIFTALPVFAQEPAEINFFYSSTCPHCEKEHKFLDEFSGIKINRFEISKNSELLKEFYKKYNVPKNQWGLVPITFTPDNYFLGFNQETSKNIAACIEKCVSGKDYKLPIDVDKYSLPVMAVVLGILDGFNVCSLGALIFILTLALALKSRKKTLIFGGLFILTTAVVYGILIIIWYKVFSFFAGYLRILEILLGILGLAGGAYFLKEFIRFKKYGPTCKIGASQKIMAKFSQKFQAFFKSSGNFALLIIAVLVFAGIITIIEFPCSALVPVAFAGILVKAQLPAFYYLLYIILFVFFYMLDEIIIFLAAFFTMRIWFASNKSMTVWIALVQAIILFSLGFYYLFL